MRTALRGIHGWQWLVMAVLMVLPGSFLLLPLFSWFLTRRAAA